MVKMVWPRGKLTAFCMEKNGLRVGAGDYDSRKQSDEVRQSIQNYLYSFSSVMNDIFLRRGRSGLPNTNFENITTEGQRIL